MDKLTVSQINEWMNQLNSGRITREMMQKFLEKPERVFPSPARFIETTMVPTQSILGRTIDENSPELKIRRYSDGVSRIYLPEEIRVDYADTELVKRCKFTHRDAYPRRQRTSGVIHERLELINFGVSVEIGEAQNMIRTRMLWAADDYQLLALAEQYPDICVTVASVHQECVENRLASTSTDQKALMIRYQDSERHLRFADRYFPKDTWFLATGN